MQTVRRILPLRTILGGIILAYLACDVYLFDGPLNRWIQERKRGTREAVARAVREDWIATVNGKPVTRSDHLHRIEEILYLRGQSYASLGREQRLSVRRQAANQLIDDFLLAEKVRLDRKAPGVKEEDFERAVERFSNLFPSGFEMQASLRSRGLETGDEKESIRKRLAQQAWIEDAIGDTVRVTDEEAREFYESRGREEMKLASCVRASHIFISTVGKEVSVARSAIEKVIRQLDSGDSTFEELAAKFSEDPATKKRGGDLGYFSGTRMPREFTKVVFALAPGELSAPFQTKIGWHLVKLTDKKSAREATFEELLPDIAAFLEGRKRDKAVDKLIDYLRQNAKIQIFPHIILANADENELFAHD